MSRSRLGLAAVALAAAFVLAGAALIMRAQGARTTQLGCGPPSPPTRLQPGQAVASTAA